MKVKHESFNLINILIILNMAVMISDYKVISNKIGAVCSLGICIWILMNNVKVTKLDFKLIACMFLFLLYYVISSNSNGNYANTLETVIYYCIEFSSIFITIHFVNHRNTKMQKNILMCFFVIWDIFCVLAIKSYIVFPDLAREMAANRAEYRSLIIGGGYPMAYGSAMLGVFLVQLLLDKKICLKNRRAIQIEVIVLFLLVYFTNSFIILIAMIMGCVCCYMYQKIKGSWRFFSIILIVVLAFIISLNLENILEWILEINENEFLEYRLYEIYDYVANDVTSYHLNARITVYESSYQTFLENPIWGVGYKFGNIGSLQKVFGIGSHSTILDSLAQFGIIGSLPLFGILVFPFFSNKKRGYESTYLIALAVMLFLNPCFTTYHLILVVYLIIPLMQNLIYRKES